MIPKTFKIIILALAVILLILIFVFLFTTFEKESSLPNKNKPFTPTQKPIISKTSPKINLQFNPSPFIPLDPTFCYKNYNFSSDMDQDGIIDDKDDYIVVDKNKNNNPEFHRTLGKTGSVIYLFIDENDDKKPECQWMDLDDDNKPTFFVADFDHDGSYEIKWIDQDGDGNADYFEEDQDGNNVIDYVWADENDDSTPNREFDWNVHSGRKTPFDVGPYLWHNNVSFPWFHLGKGGESANAWDNYWEYHYGGTDWPFNRNPDNIYFPEGFTPKENPFYTASLYDDVQEKGRPADAKLIPWAWDVPEFVSLMKNRWVEVKYNSKSCFAQIQDTGPYASFDNMFKEGTHNYDGFDLSPAVWYCLGVPLDWGRFRGSWRFVNDKDVPDGPWKQIVTTSQICWEPKKEDCDKKS
ncbi:MAG: RlpA-like double-psi beta-barrel domain-containing protein [Nanoarchaeota archaeon]|nr:RlpA-like double-psi beta-barrel domain-containing protein [Nanoarchaeota archaeon]MBU1631853.1 RlpA-like double-psi beta-barrel domain-containing protein [Nanoarchaeota archaeon]MBU1875846.1 RlpA-like double-psi beta-barrel domain-containing protein [Nanoarchaeota archaeon]